jgi:hypothetical protein
MFPDHIIFSIASFLNFSFIVQNFPNLFKNFAKHNKIELFDEKDLEILIQHNSNLFIKHLVYHFKPSEENNDAMETWLTTHKINGGVVEISFVWKGRQLIQIGSICNKFKKCVAHVNGNRANYNWNLNILGNIFYNMKNKHCSFILYGGNLSHEMHCYFAQTIQSLTLNKVHVYPNYNMTMLRSKVNEFFHV